MSYIQTTATRKICKLNKRIRAISGGASASKTVSILIWLIGYAQHKEIHNEVISVVAETMPFLRKGAMRDFENIMKTQGYWKDSRWNSTNSIYTFDRGNIVEFFSVEDSERVKGARRHVLFINEANNVPFETYVQLEVRTRKIVFLDWNPISEFWWYTDIVPYSTDHDFLVLTYKDNEALSQPEVEALEKHKSNPGRINWWRVYGEGQLGEVEGRVYSGWQLIDEIPFEARLECYGLDFGYTNNPTAIVAVYKFNDGFILDEVAHTKGLSNKQIADILLNLPRAITLADSAEPKSIDEIASYGVDILPTLKGQGSMLQGIQYVRDQKISVTKQSLNIIKEYRNYMWMTNREGKTINEPSSALNHAMDAIRYGMSKNFITIEETPQYHLPSPEQLTGADTPYGGLAQPYDY